MPDHGFDSALVVGHGRSGTNWLLDLFDLSEQTLCRSEANELQGGVLARLPDSRFAGAHDEELDATWDTALADAFTRMGERDHRLPARKAYSRPLARALGLETVVRRPRARRALARMLPSLRGGEWDYPRWLAPPERLAAAFPVMKLVQVPGWGAWVVGNRPGTYVTHIVRHPGGFLNSWRKRYVAKNDPAAVTRANRERLDELCAADPRWRSVLGPLDRMSMEEMELWYWRYAAEVVHEAGADTSSYRLVVYERLTAETRRIVREIYDDCGLPWTSEVEAGVARFAEGSRRIASAWQSALSPADVELVEKVLAGSVLRTLWEPSS